MARVTVEDCLKRVENRFELVALASVRAMQLHRGSEPLLKTKNKAVVTSLREIAADKVRVHRKKEIVAPVEAAS